MIRLFTALCKTLFENLSDEYIYLNAANNFCCHTEKCPNCGASIKLSYHSDYSRGLVSFEDGKAVDRRIRPKRFKCASCGTTHALLPDTLVPYSPYSLRFKLFVLLAYFQKDMTVEAVCQHFGIAISTIYRWKECLLSHKELLLGALLNLKEPALAFLHGLFDSACLSKSLHSFFNKHAFSFMQCAPAIATPIRPP
jgi:transposase-like protein